ncbi:MAG: L-histidine N(alpha)-methyltransferase [Gammaproteobacteria bacterium]|nr:L-histidine N(alpha)-methyltransferase [Gammaproteobacteria bacterium]
MQEAVELDTGRFQLNRLSSAQHRDSLAEDVRHGLMSEPRVLLPKYFYDERGSKLFDQICQTEEYYLTRTESILLKKHADEIIAITRPTAIVEYGSGTSEKTELLIQAAHQQYAGLHYLPLDVCEEILVEAGDRLIERYPELSIDAWHGDFLDGMDHFKNGHKRSLYVFLGSSLGNFSENEAIGFLRGVRNTIKDSDWFLLGVDMVKDHAILNAAYNDNRGHTAAFNLNVLNVLNQALDGNFNKGKFKHQAFFDTEHSRIEMRLLSCCQQTVTLHDIDLKIEFEEGEHIVTEYSRKYTADSIRQLLSKAGFKPQNIYTGNNNEFMLILSSCSEADER